MQKTIDIEVIISSRAADDADKGNLVFECIKQSCNPDDKTVIILDFENIELVNTAFLNNAIGLLFNRQEFDLLKNSVFIRNMKDTMRDLLKETISLAREKYL